MHLSSSRSIAALIFVTLALRSLAASGLNCSTQDQLSALRSFYRKSGGSDWLASTGWNTDLEPCKWLGVKCSTDALVTSVHLPFNNVSGPELGGIISPALGCSLISLNLQGNHLSGSVPSGITIALPKLQSLNLASNNLSGSLPIDLFESPSSGQAMVLEYLDLSWNALDGLLPWSICPNAGNSSNVSSLVNLFLSHNNLGGSLNLTGCSNLVLVDVSMNVDIGNSIESDPYGSSTNRHLSVASILGTNVDDIESLISSSPRISLLDAANTQLAVLPSNIASLQSLISLRIANTLMNGTIPYDMFLIGSLQKVDLSNNFLSGLIPSITGAKGLSHFDLSFNLMWGLIPPSFVDVLGNRGSFLDLRLNFLSCCGILPLILENSTAGVGTNISYSGYNLSLPRLPPGLKFSKALRPVTYNTLFQGLFSFLQNNLGNSSFSGLQCPYLLPENATDTPENYLAWNLDPEYYLFEGCQCYEGGRAISVPYNGFILMQCVDPLPLAQQWWRQYPWLIALIAIIGFLFLSVLVWSIYSAIRSARKQKVLLKETQKANAKLEEEHIKMQALLARQFDLIKCFDADKRSKSHALSKARRGSQSEGLTVGAVEAVKRSIARGEEDDNTEAMDVQIEIHQVIGEGSYGKVYRGLWRGTLVAIKMMVLPAHMSGQEKRETMAVMEAAISSALSHPNIVTTYTYSIKPCEDLNMKNAVGENLATNSGTDDKEQHSTERSKEKSSSVDKPSQKMHILSYEVRLVIELCNKGTLRQALDYNCFTAHDKVNYSAILDTARDVASAMAHIHSAQILHADLKASNILLKSDASDPRGFVAKVADFGLALKMDQGMTHASGLFQGTLSHMAPEVMLHGKQSKAADVYSFGIFLWELSTAGTPYKEIHPAHIGHYITKQKKRPEWPEDSPLSLQSLAERCWAHDPEHRPSFDDIYQLLVEMRREVKSPTPVVTIKDPAPPSAPLVDQRSSPSLDCEAAALVMSTASANRGSFLFENSPVLLPPPPRSDVHD